MTYLDVLAQSAATMGWPVERRQETGPYPCPVHDVPLTAHQISTYTGWFQVRVCPQHDETCTYGPDGNPERIDRPLLDTEPAKPAV